jgi:uncharacterized membrane protein
MPDAKPRLSAPHIKPVRIVRAHIRLFTALALGIVLFLVLPGDLRATTRILIAWNVAAAFYLVLATYVIAQCDVARMRLRAEQEDEGGTLILVLTVAAAAASLVAIFAEMGAVPAERAGALPAILALSTVVLSWVFIQVIFALHYAHEFYGEAKGGHKGGLQFPEDDRPEYWDFVYFSFVIGMTFQVSDVQVTNKSLRRLVVAHGAVSFFYNVAVIALMVNIGGEFIKG